MAELNAKTLSQHMSRRLASFKLPDSVIAKLADRVLINGWSIGRFNPCIYGICLDYFTDKVPDLSDLLKKPGISRFEVFPYGIINPDRFHVQVGYSVDELVKPEFALGAHN